MFVKNLFKILSVIVITCLLFTKTDFVHANELYSGNCPDAPARLKQGYNGQDGWSAEVGPDGKYNMIPNSQPMPGTIETPGGQSENSQQPSRPDVYPDSFLGT